MNNKLFLPIMSTVFLELHFMAFCWILEIDLPPEKESSLNVRLRTRKGAGQSEGNIFLEMLPYVL